MNHTPESHAEAQASVAALKKPACGWCISTHMADIRCICEEPCKNEKTGDPVGWCSAIDKSDPFSPRFL